MNYIASLAVFFSALRPWSHDPLLVLRFAECGFYEPEQLQYFRIAPSWFEEFWHLLGDSCEWLDGPPLIWCRGCWKRCDPTVCWCGMDQRPRVTAHGGACDETHPFTAMGCTCYYHEQPRLCRVAA